MFLLRRLANAACQHQHTDESQRADGEAKKLLSKFGQFLFQLLIGLDKRLRDFFISNSLNWNIHKGMDYHSRYKAKITFPNSVLTHTEQHFYNFYSSAF